MVSVRGVCPSPFCRGRVRRHYSIGKTSVNSQFLPVFIGFSPGDACQVEGKCRTCGTLGPGHRPSLIAAGDSVSRRLPNTCSTWTVRSNGEHEPSPGACGVFSHSGSWWVSLVWDRGAPLSS